MIKTQKHMPHLHVLSIIFHAFCNVNSFNSLQNTSSIMQKNPVSFETEIVFTYRNHSKCRFNQILACNGAIRKTPNRQTSFSISAREGCAFSEISADFHQPSALYWVITDARLLHRLFLFRLIIQKVAVFVKHISFLLYHYMRRSFYSNIHITPHDCQPLLISYHSRIVVIA